MFDHFRQNCARFSNFAISTLRNQDVRVYISYLSISQSCNGVCIVRLGRCEHSIMFMSLTLKERRSELRAVTALPKMFYASQQRSFVVSCQGATAWAHWRLVLVRLSAVRSFLRPDCFMARCLMVLCLLLIVRTDWKWLGLQPGLSLPRLA